MAILDQRTVRVLVTVLLFLAGFAFVWAAWKMLVAFLFSIFFAYVIEPLVKWIGRRLHISRGLSIAIVYLGVFAGLALLFLSVGPSIVREGVKLSRAVPDLYNKIATGRIAWQLGSQHGWSYETEQRIQEFLASNRTTILNIAENIGKRLAELGANAWYLVLIPILAVFFVKDGEQISDSILDFFSRRRQREFIDALLNDIHLMLAQYIRTQLILAGIAMGVYIALLTVMRVPYGSALGVISGMLEFIPVVGPAIAVILIVSVSLAAGYGKVLYLVIFLAVWRGLEDYVISPRLMGGKVKLHPLAVLFGVLVGGEIGGIIGVYLSVPIMAAIRIFWRRWRDYAMDTNLTPVSPLMTVERDKTA